MPAERGIGFGIERFRCAVWVARRESISEMVEGGEWVRRRISASMAATGMVRRGSLRRSWWYCWTMLNKGLKVEFQCNGDGGLTRMEESHWGW